MAILSYDNSSINSIGLVYYYIEVIMPMTDEQRQYIIDQDTKAALYAISQSHAINPSQGYVDIQSEIIKARTQGSKRANDIRKTLIQKSVYHQVGQQESIDELVEIERHKDFRGWLNPDLISHLITISNV